MERIVKRLTYMEDARCLKFKTIDIPLAVPIGCRNSALVRFHKQSESRLAALACCNADTAEVLASDRRKSNTTGSA
jgi:hypothetical protein